MHRYTRHGHRAWQAGRKDEARRWCVRVVRSKKIPTNERHSAHYMLACLLLAERSKVRDWLGPELRAVCVDYLFEAGAHLARINDPTFDPRQFGVALLDSHTLVAIAEAHHGAALAILKNPALSGTLSGRQLYGIAWRDLLAARRILTCPPLREKVCREKGETAFERALGITEGFDQSGWALPVSA